MHQTCTYAWPTPGSSVSNLLSVSEASTDGRFTRSVQGNRTNGTCSVTDGAGYRYVTNVAPDGTWSLSTYHNGWLASMVRKAADGAQLAQVTYGYDAHGRLTTMTDARTGATTYQYDDLDRVTAVTTPPPDGVAGAQTTTSAYDVLGRVWRTVLPDSSTVTNDYYDTGELRSTAGSRTYPVEYSYDYAGRMQTLKTWQTAGEENTAATTTWHYDGLRGWLTNKTYPLANGPGYAYSKAGRLLSRAWVRTVSGSIRLTATYVTNTFGEVAEIHYNDNGATPGVTNTYDRLGRLVTVSTGDSLLGRTYDLWGRLTSESFDGVTVTNAYDTLGRRTNVTVDPAAPLLSQAYAFDPQTGRLQSAGQGSVAATYSYVANAAWVGQIDFQHNGQTQMSASKSYDNLNRLTQVGYVTTAPATVAAFGYTYNAANQRTKVTLGPDGAYWDYGYDELGQVTSGKKYWSDGTAVAGQQFEYGFDDIGNRRWTQAGGDAAGANLRLANYTNNLNNQLVGRDVPGTNDVIGIAHASAAVTVNGAAVSRKGEYFWKEVPVGNAAAPAYAGVTNQAVFQGTTNTVEGHLLVAATPQTVYYDNDGNVIYDGLWARQRDGENRVKLVMANPFLPGAARAQVVWSYYPDGRWQQRVEYRWENNNWVAQSTNRFLWDGQQLLAVLDHTNGLALSFLRGLDLSGTPTGGGGTGGLLALTVSSGGQSTEYFYCSDGNGNVTALVDASTGKVAARYEYGPFGEAVRVSGEVAATNPLRFSSQYTDGLTGEVKYLYRVYWPEWGRWLSRDPINERGFKILTRSRTRSNQNEGKNLYVFVTNDPLRMSRPIGHEPDRRPSRCIPRLVGYQRRQFPIWKGRGLVRSPLCFALLRAQPESAIKLPHRT